MLRRGVRPRECAPQHGAVPLGPKGGAAGVLHADCHQDLSWRGGAVGAACNQEPAGCETSPPEIVKLYGVGTRGQEPGSLAGSRFANGLPPPLRSEKSPALDDAQGRRQHRRHRLRRHNAACQRAVPRRERMGWCRNGKRGGERSGSDEPGK